MNDSGPAASAAALEILKPGPLMTVQDLGRPAWGRFGVSPSGAMDPIAARAANRLAGNRDGAALLEITGAGGALRFEGACRIGLTGGDLGAELAPGGSMPARPLPPLRAADLEPGQQLRFTARRGGARGYLAIAGGLDVPPVFGSAATDLSAGLGGAGGRPLRAGDRLRGFPLDVGRGAPPGSEPVAGGLAADVLERWAAGVYGEPGSAVRVALRSILRFVPAPGAPPGAAAALAAAPYRVTPRSNRAGYQLEGSGLPLADGGLLSEPIAPGAIQILPDGQPILLMADRQTVGGYPVVGWLARADLPRAAQLWPDDRVSFVALSAGEAQAALREQEAALAAVFAAPAA